ncbi:MAG: hypothetical protein J6S96_04020 [Muribaculaceae bacterium]|nr:hypothetical protein [Muribaculaceae bacterium]
MKRSVLQDNAILRAFIITIVLIVCSYVVDAQHVSSSTAMSSMLIDSIQTPMNVRYDGSSLLIASNDGNGTEMCYWFKRCMNNELFTFYRVGYRMVNHRTTSSAAAITNDKSIVWLNKTESDNIGPVSIDGYADFVGGNHLWKKPDSNGSKGKGENTTVKTATCDNVFISIDGQPISQGCNTSCRIVKIEVFNTIYDPLIEPKKNDYILSSPLISEQVEYFIVGNSIDVRLTHVYAKDLKVRCYYGMQSMFVDETKLFTPNGKFSSGITPSDNLKFNKSQYPLFNRFIEFNTNGWCQSSWIENSGLGQHLYLSDNSVIFTRGTGKSYHVLINNKNLMANTTYQWHGVYTWAKPLVYDNSLIVYTGYIDGREAIYVDVRKNLDNFCVNIPYYWIKAHKLERTGDINATVSGNVLKVSASGSSSVVLIKKYYPDAVEDITYEQQASNDNWYDMQGRILLSEPSTPGIYIHNGKKTLVQKR